MVGEKVLKDSIQIKGRKPRAFEKLDEYDIDILLVQREWMTQPLQKEKNWIPIFENFNAGLYLRNAPENAANLQRCADYYHGQGIPFDKAKGFDERAAYQANSQWATRFRVERKHLKMDTNLMAAGW